MNVHQQRMRRARRQPACARPRPDLVRYLQSNGFPGAVCSAPCSLKQIGDIAGTPGIVWNIKGLVAVPSACDLRLAAWLDTLDTQCRYSDAAVGMLAVQLPACEPERWWAITTVDAVTGLVAQATGGRESEPEDPSPVRMRVAEAVWLLRAAGYGEPLDKPPLGQAVAG